jgi:hypothetical protein
MHKITVEITDPAGGYVGLVYPDRLSNMLSWCVDNTPQHKYPTSFCKDDPPLDWNWKNVGDQNHQTQRVVEFWFGDPHVAMAFALRWS